MNKDAKEQDKHTHYPEYLKFHDDIRIAVLKCTCNMIGIAPLFSSQSPVFAQDVKWLDNEKEKEK